MTSTITNTKNIPMPTSLNHIPTTRALALLLALLLPALPGCGIVSWLAHGVAGGEKRVKVKAEYTDLADQRIAVLVAADSRTLFRAPQAPEMICRAVSSYLAEHVEGATLMNPRQAIAFQNDNPHWPTTRPGELLEKLEVDRLILIDLAEYRLHEPGNRHLARGMVTANVAVHARDADDPDNPAYYRTVATRFPEDSTVGVVNADEQSLELGMVKSFSLSVARLFHEHEIKR